MMPSSKYQAFDKKYARRNSICLLPIPTIPTPEIDLTLYSIDKHDPHQELLLLIWNNLNPSVDK